MAATQRITAGAVIAAACAASLAGCAIGDNGSPQGAHGPHKAAPAPAPKSGVRLIGDGSTSYTGRSRICPDPSGSSPARSPRSSWSSPSTA